MPAIKRLDPARCAGLLIDVQDYFLQQLNPAHRRHIETRTTAFVQLLSYLRLPLTVTLERPLATKGALASAINFTLEAGTSAWTSGEPKIFEKEFFDLSREPVILEHLRAFGRDQMILAGCETDVCVLESCLGLLGHGYEVYIVEDLLFSSSTWVESALTRMSAAGAVLLTFKTLFHELMQSVESSHRRSRITTEHGPLPDALAAAVASEP